VFIEFNNSFFETILPNMDYQITFLLMH